MPCEYTGGRFIHVSPFEPRAGETGRVFIFSDKAFQAPSDFGFKPTQNHIHGGYGKPIRWRSVGGVAAGGFGFVGEYTFGEPGTYRMKKGQTEAQLSCPELIVLKARRRSRQSVSASNEKQAQASRLRQTQPNVVPETATPSPRPNPNEQKPVLEPQPSEVAKMAAKKTASVVKKAVRRPKRYKKSEWSDAVELFYSIWIYELFKAPEGMSWKSLHALTSQRSRNLLHGHLNQHEDLLPKSDRLKEEKAKKERIKAAEANHAKADQGEDNSTKNPNQNRER